MGEVLNVGSDKRRCIDLRAAGLRRPPAVERPVSSTRGRRQFAHSRVLLHETRRLARSAAIAVECHGEGRRRGALDEIDAGAVELRRLELRPHAGGVAELDVDRRYRRDVVEHATSKAREALRNGHAFERRTRTERIVADRRHAGRQDDACKRVAISECRGINKRDGCRDCHARKRAAFVKGIAADSRQSRRQAYRLKRPAAIERVRSYLRHARRNHNAFQCAKGSEAIQSDSRHHIAAKRGRHDKVNGLRIRSHTPCNRLAVIDLIAPGETVVVSPFGIALRLPVGIVGDVAAHLVGGHNLRAAFRVVKPADVRIPRARRARQRTDRLGILALHARAASAPVRVERDGKLRLFGNRDRADVNAGIARREKRAYPRLAVARTVVDRRKSVAAAVERVFLYARHCLRYGNPLGVVVGERIDGDCRHAGRNLRPLDCCERGAIGLPVVQHAVYDYKIVLLRVAQIEAIAKFHVCRQCGSCGNIHAHKIVATHECAVVDGRHAVRQDKARKPVAVFKRPAFDLSHAARNRQGRNAAASEECLVPDCRDRAAAENRGDDEFPGRLGIDGTVAAIVNRRLAGKSLVVPGAAVGIDPRAGNRRFDDFPPVRIERPVEKVVALVLQNRRGRHLVAAGGTRKPANELPLVRAVGARRHGERAAWCAEFDLFCRRGEGVAAVHVERDGKVEWIGLDEREIIDVCRIRRPPQQPFDSRGVVLVDIDRLEVRERHGSAGARPEGIHLN